MRNKQKGKLQRGMVYLRRAVEMHTGYWECSYIHCNTPIQVQRANYAEKSSANNRPRKREKQGRHSVMKFRRFIYFKFSMTQQYKQTPKLLERLKSEFYNYS